LGEAGLDDFLRADDVDPLARPGLAAVFLGVLTGADASKRPARTPTSPARGSRRSGPYHDRDGDV